MMAQLSNISISSLASRVGLVVLAISCLASCGADEVDDEEVLVINNASTTNNSGTNAPINSTANNGTPNGSSNGATNSGATNNGAPNNGTTINENCPPEARPVYLVEASTDDPTAQGTLVRFDPQDRQFTDIGVLSCPAEPGAQPFSMSVDRDATAWVLYGSGELFEVSTTDGSCEATSFQSGQSGYDVFGMGFVLNNPNVEDETLYVAGGSGPGSGESPRIGYITFPELSLTDITTIDGWPEMSGTAAAELWAFFPGPLTGSPRVSRIVPATGEEVEEIAVDSVISGNPNAWAFAHWGGRFYLFYKSQADPSTNVFEVQRDGTVEEIIPNSGRYIVGAGVSTCAPLLIL